MKFENKYSYMTIVYRKGNVHGEEKLYWRAIAADINLTLDDRHHRWNNITITVLLSTNYDAHINRNY